MQSKIPLMAYENYMNNEQRSLFENLNLPEGYDKEQVVNTILFRSGEFECAYNDPYYMVYAIGLWGSNWNRTFDKWLKNLDIEYALNPLENYDRYEDTMRDNTGTQGTVAHSENSASDSSNSTDKVSAFNSDTMRDNTSMSSSSNASGENDSDITRTDNLKETTISHIHGNIGVTTSSTLLKESLEVAKFNLYNQIADIFIQEFCVLIY